MITVVKMNSSMVKIGFLAYLCVCVCVFVCLCSVISIVRVRVVFRKTVVGD